MRLQFFIFGSLHGILLAQVENNSKKLCVGKYLRKRDTGAVPWNKR